LINILRTNILRINCAPSWLYLQGIRKLARCNTVWYLKKICDEALKLDSILYGGFKTYGQKDELPTVCRLLDWYADVLYPTELMFAHSWSDASRSVGLDVRK